MVRISFQNRLKFRRKEQVQMQSNKRKILKCVTLIVGVLIIPMIYGGVYLASVWDAYGNLDALPVAVVNEDKGADGKPQGKQDIGLELCQC